VLWKEYRTHLSQLIYPLEDASIGMIEMLFNTSLVELVGSGDPTFSPRKLRIVNTKVSLNYELNLNSLKRLSTICELTFVSSVLAVKMNRKRLIVLIEEHIYIYDISNMKLLHTIDTIPNVNGNFFH
jgi:autophagy-related protein 18